jgi:hypothetical protein
MGIDNSKSLLGGGGATLSQESDIYKLETSHLKWAESDLIVLHSTSLQYLTLLLVCVEKVLDDHMFQE